MECFASYIIISLHVCADSGSPAPARVMAFEEFLCINGRVAERERVHSPRSRTRVMGPELFMLLLQRAAQDARVSARV
jgi:hypothetical protein